MSRHRLATLSCFVAAGAGSLASGCGDKAGRPAAAAAAPTELRGVQAQAPAPAAAAALVQLPETEATKRRLAYVNLGRLGQVTGAVPRTTVLRQVLGAGARRVTGLPTGAATTVAQVGGATVLRGPGVPGAGLGGRPSGDDGVVLGGGEVLSRKLQATTHTQTAITRYATSSVQSCLGDTTAQVIVGPAVMGRDAALGVGLRKSADKPAGVQLAVCYAPRYIRQIDEGDVAVTRRYGRVADGARSPIIGEREIGERELLSAVLPADRLPSGELADLLRGGPRLRALIGQ